MPDRPTTKPAHIIAAVFLAGATAFCVAGVSLVIEDYDGVLSWFNPFAAGSCCVAVVLLLVSAVIAGTAKDK
jgi:hypothetical protein